MTLTLRPATWRDLPRLRRWRNDPETVRWSNGRRVTWREHLIWWWAAPPWRRIYIAEVSGRPDRPRPHRPRPVGMGRSEMGIISYSVARRWRGHGIGTLIVGELVSRHPREVGPMWAETHPEHLASHAVLLKNGFQPAAEVQHPDQPALQALLLKNRILLRNGRFDWVHW